MPPAGYVAKTHRETPLACHCKMGRCFDCRLCPRRSCKINRCECPAGPTRLRVPKQRKLGEVLAVPGNLATVAAAPAASAAPEADPFGYLADDGYDYTPRQQQQQQQPSPPTERVVPANLANQVVRYKPLEYPEDVVEALQLPKRTIMSRFQRRRIAQEGIAAMQSNFEKASLKRTRQTFRDGIQKLAQVLLPEAPDYLLAALPEASDKEADCLKEILRQAPRHSVQARTAAAVLVESFPYKAVEDVLSKYQWKKAQEDYKGLVTGRILEARDATTPAAERKKRKAQQLEATSEPPLDAAKPRAKKTSPPTALPLSPLAPATLMDDTLRAMLATMPAVHHNNTNNHTNGTSVQSSVPAHRPLTIEEEAQRAMMATMQQRPAHGVVAAQVTEPRPPTTAI
jgi:hypothetical protein